MNFLSGATSIDSFFKAYKTSETKKYLPPQLVWSPLQMQNAEFSHRTLFTANFVALTLLKHNIRTMLTSWKVDWPQNKTLSNWNHQSQPLLGLRIIKKLQRNWKQEQMISFKDLWHWYKKKIPSLEVMQETTTFHHNKTTDILKLGCILPNLANICLHKSTDTKIYLFTEANKDFSEKTRENVVGGPSVVSTGKAVVDEILVLTNICKSVVAIGNYTPTRCVNPCPPLFIRVAITIRRQVDSHFDKKGP